MAELLPSASQVPFTTLKFDAARRLAEQLVRGARPGSHAIIFDEQGEEICSVSACSGDGAVPGVTRVEPRHVEVPTELGDQVC